MARRHNIPPEIDKEIIAFGLNMNQMLWAAGGLALSFGGFTLLTQLTESPITSAIFGIPLGLIAVPFVFIKPKKGTLTFAQYIGYRFQISRRQNELPNQRIIRKVSKREVHGTQDDDSVMRKSVADVDINLRGGH